MATKEQRNVKRAIVRIGQKRHETRKQIVSALETGRVESNFQNLRYGDGTSVGWRQETKSSYPNVNRNDLKGSINRYYNETDRAGKGRGVSAGTLAQSVQRSAFPGRYDQYHGEAVRTFKRLSGKGQTSRGGATSGGSRTTTVKTTKRTPGVDRSAMRQALVLDLLKTKPGTQRSSDPLQQSKRNASDSANVLSTITQVQNTPDTPGKKVTTTKRTKVRTPAGQAQGGKRGSDTSLKGTANFEGKTVAAWIKPELVYARRHGWKGTVSSGFRSFADQTRIYNSGVRPAARPGTSNHEGSQFPRGAVDVTDATQLSSILRRKGSKLKYAGAKDPVHFSAPHGGGY